MNIRIFMLISYSGISSEEVQRELWVFIKRKKTEKIYIHKRMQYSKSLNTNMFHKVLQYARLPFSFTIWIVFYKNWMYTLI